MKRFVEGEDRQQATLLPAWPEVTGNTKTERVVTALRYALKCRRGRFGRRLEIDVVIAAVERQARCGRLASGPRR